MHPQHCKIMMVSIHVSYRFGVLWLTCVIIASGPFLTISALVPTSASACSSAPVPTLTLNSSQHPNRSLEHKNDHLSFVVGQHESKKKVWDKQLSVASGCQVAEASQAAAQLIKVCPLPHVLFLFVVPALPSCGTWNTCRAQVQPHFACSVWLAQQDQTLTTFTNTVNVLGMQHTHSEVQVYVPGYSVVGEFDLAVLRTTSDD